jgi:hypothetical protein
MVDWIFSGSVPRTPHLWEFTVPAKSFTCPSIFLLASAIALFSLTSTTRPAIAAPAKTIAAISISTEKQPILLADEIIRRLRRLGLNFTKNRIAHPYDPFGELC